MPSRHALIARQAGPQKMLAKTFPAPVAGWVTADSLVASRPASAQVLENIFPQQMSVRLRGGSRKWADIGKPVVSLLTYVGGSVRRMFAASVDTLFDITVPNAAEEAVTDQTGGYYSFVNFATDGGEFLIAVNGADPLLNFDGTDWSQVTGVSTPLAITNVDTSLLTHVSAYRNRLFFVEGGSMRIWYLPVNSIAGAASNISLSGVFGRGGSILFTGTWSMDAGDGMDDKFVVVSTEGEVAVYEGANPSDADDWYLVGKYEITPPLGPRATMRAGGDLLIATEEGLIPISSAINKDSVALSLAAISRAIEPNWVAESTSRRAFPWEIARWPRKNMAIISLPIASETATDHYCFVVNLETGAWAKFTGWDTRCLALHENAVFFGTSDGRVLQAEVGGDDDGEPYFPTMVGNWDHLKAMGSIKTVRQARATFLTASDINPQLSISTDYSLFLPSPPNAPLETATPSLWDVGNWDEAEWDDGAQKVTFSTMWVSIGQSGYSIAPQLQMMVSGAIQPTAELVEMTLIYEMGGLVV